jgi:hypothetical protein
VSNPDDDHEPFHDESDEPWDFPEDYESGKAWAEVRIISPDGMDATTKLPKLTPEQGLQLNILVMRLMNGDPVLVMAGGKEY